MTAATGLRDELLVVVAEDLLAEHLAEINRERRDRPWRVVAPHAGRMAISPLFGRPGAACWACMAHRVDLRARGIVARRLDPPADADALLVYADDDALVTLDPTTHQRWQHPVVRRPQCSACGEPLDPARTPAPLTLRPSVPGARTSGGLRAEQTATTLRRLASAIGDVTGLVGKPRQAHPPPDVSYVAEHAFATPSASPDSQRRRIALRAGGTGATPAAARASVVGEALERYCGVYHGDEPERRAAWADVGDAAIHPDALQHISAAQYAERAVTNPENPYAQHVPEPFDERASTAWSPAWSLTHAHETLVPAALSYYGHPDRFYGSANSNGCAAGSCFEEALLQALLELVERDAVAVWWFNRTPVRAVEPTGAYAAAWTQRQAAAGRRTWILDLTHDLGVPVFAAIAVGRGGSIIYGFGAHLDEEIALERALAEVNQSLPYLVGMRSGGTRSLWLTDARSETLPWLTPTDDAPRQPVPGGGGTDIATACRQLVDLLAARGLEVLALDQSRPDVPLSVVRAFVPGLRHFWRRLAPGRLYTVPVELGRLPEARAEGELNPWDLYF